MYTSTALKWFNAPSSGSLGKHFKRNPVTNQIEQVQETSFEEVFRQFVRDLSELKVLHIIHDVYGSAEDLKAVS